MGTTGLILLTALGLALWLWRNSLAIREAAIHAARQTCQHQQLQLLDGTVVLRDVAMRRSAKGRLVLRRTYEFTYSEFGMDRKAGFVIMLGDQLEQVGL